jgi:tetratricopeptide (TPR) repeat protein
MEPGSDPRAPAKLRYQLARALDGQGRFAEALAEARAALDILPQHPELQRFEGAILLRAGDAAAAVEAFERAIALAEKFHRKSGQELPALHRWRYELAQALSRVGREAEAAAIFSEYRKAQAEDIEARRREAEGGGGAR